MAKYQDKKTFEDLARRKRLTVGELIVRLELDSYEKLLVWCSDNGVEAPGSQLELALGTTAPALPDGTKDAPDWQESAKKRKRKEEPEGA